MTSIAAQEAAFISDFNELDDWFLQYEYLVELTALMEPLTAEEKNPVNKVAGCQSNIWLVLEHDSDILKIRAHSDSLLIRGILAVLVALLNDRACAKILDYEMRFIECTTLKNQLSTDRFKGMALVLQHIKDFARKIWQNTIKQNNPAAK